MFAPAMDFGVYVTLIIILYLYIYIIMTSKSAGMTLLKKNYYASR
jgi:hypothetical protein